MTSAEIAAELDTSVHQVLRTLHEHGIPVRRGGSGRKGAGDPAALKRLAAHHEDPDVTALLRRHGIPERPEPAAVQFDVGVDGLVGCDDVHIGGGDVEFGMDLRELDPSTSDQGTCPALL